MTYRPFLSENFLIQKVGTKFFMEKDSDPAKNRLDLQHWIIFLVENNSDKQLKGFVA
jgi:hypothetical protein